MHAHDVYALRCHCVLLLCAVYFAWFTRLMEEDFAKDSFRFKGHFGKELKYLAWPRIETLVCYICISGFSCWRLWKHEKSDGPAAAQTMAVLKVQTAARALQVFSPCVLQAHLGLTQDETDQLAKFSTDLLDIARVLATAQADGITVKRRPSCIFSV